LGSVFPARAAQCLRSAKRTAVKEVKLQEVDTDKDNLIISENVHQFVVDYPGDPFSSLESYKEFVFFSNSKLINNRKIKQKIRVRKFDQVKNFER
jgi:hypothetical protein